jgi:hypothetical protein
MLSEPNGHTKRHHASVLPDLTVKAAPPAVAVSLEATAPSMTELCQSRSGCSEKPGLLTLPLPWVDGGAYAGARRGLPTFPAVRRLETRRATACVSTRYSTGCSGWAGKW